MPLIKRSSILSVKTFPIPTVLDDPIAVVMRDEGHAHLALFASLVTSQAHVMKFWLRYDTMESAHIIWEQKTLLRTLSSLWR